MSTPDYVQNTYDRVMSDGLPGGMADANPTMMKSFFAEVADIPFGRVISVGSTYGPPAAAILGGGTVAATAGYLQGSAVTTAMAVINAITTGAVKITVDGSVKTLTALDFSTCNTYADCAAVIETALTSAVGLVTFSPVTGCFRITSATTGSSSAVSAIADNTTGDSILAAFGFDGTNIIVAGTASHTAVVLGVSVRSLTVEGGPRSQSNTSVVKVGDVGAVLVDGRIKVLVKEACSARGSVYFNNTTGEIYASSGSGKTQLGSAKFQFDAAENTVVIIDVTGLR